MNIQRNINPINNFKKQTAADNHNTQHFIVLDGMRGIAAIAVAYFHGAQLLIGERFSNETPALAVDFFFCLSGFVVAYAYGNRLSQGMTLSNFVKRRIIRLYPMIALGATLGGAVLVFGALHRHDASFGIVVEAAGALVLLPTGLLFHAQAYPTNNPIWSLFFEGVANVLYAGSPKFSIVLISAVTFVSAVALTVISYYYHGLGNVGFKDWSSFLAGFVRVCYPFLAGVLVYRLGLYKILPCIPVSVGIVTLIAALSIPLHPDWIYHAALSIIIYPLIVILGANSTAGISRGVMVWLGQISYPLYLLHQPLLRIVKNVPAVSFYATSHPILMLSTCVCACCVASMAVFHLYDVRVRDWAARAFLKYA